MKIFNGFDNHFGQIKCLENEKNEKPKKTSGQDNIILFDFCQAQPKPSLAGLSLAIYPISTPTPTPTRERLSRQAGELKFGTDTH